MARSHHPALTMVAFAFIAPGASLAAINLGTYTAHHLHTFSLTEWPPPDPYLTNESFSSSPSTTQRSTSWEDVWRDPWGEYHIGVIRAADGMTLTRESFGPAYVKMTCRGMMAASYENGYGVWTLNFRQVPSISQAFSVTETGEYAIIANIFAPGATLTDSHFSVSDLTNNQIVREIELGMNQGPYSQIVRMQLQQGIEYNLQMRLFADAHLTVSFGDRASAQASLNARLELVQVPAVSLAISPLALGYACMRRRRSA